MEQKHMGVDFAQPRVQRSEMVESGEVFTLHSWDTADGKTRLLMPMDCTDEEFAAAEAALKESDETLEAMAKLKAFNESFEDDEDVIARCYAVPEDQIRTQYRKRGGDSGWAEAFISESSGEGTEVHSGVPVVLRFQDVPADEFFGEWVQVDPWKWRHTQNAGWVRFE